MQHIDLSCEVTKVILPIRRIAIFPSDNRGQGAGPAWGSALRRKVRSIWRRCVDLTHFSMLSTVGKGGFGKVLHKTNVNSENLAYNLQYRGLVRVKAAQDRKDPTPKYEDADGKAVFYAMKLQYAFLSPMDLVLVMPFLRGGDLNYYLETKGPMPEAMAKYPYCVSNVD
eukprot:1333287-Amorphochlora_amoeboformis.AAC.1